jgi:hypothetical protein
MSLAFEVEDCVDHVLEHLGARERAVLRHVADQHGWNVLGLCGKEELRCRLAHLSDAAWRRLEFDREDRLHRVDHDERRLQPRDLLEDALDACLREQVEGRGADTQPIAAALDLMLGFFARRVEHGTDRVREVGRRLQQERRLADSGLAAEQHERPGHDAAAENAIEFGDAG